MTLTLGTGVTFLPGKDVWVSYDAEYAGRMGAILRDAVGNMVGSLSRRMVADTTAGPERPVVASVQVAGTELTLTFDRALDVNSAPAGSRFRVVVHPVKWDEPSRFFQGTGTAAVSGQTVTVTLASAVEQGETALVAYRKGDESNPLRDAAGAKPEVESFWWTMATVLDRTVPKLNSIVATSSVIFLYYDEKLDTDSTPPKSAFTVTVGTVLRTVTSVEVKEDAVGLGFSGAGGSGAPTVSYVVPGSNPIRDAKGNPAAAFSDQTATVADASAAPALTEAATNGDIVTLTFDRALSPAHVPAASAFTVQDLQDEQLNEFLWGQTIMSVAVRGSTVVLEVSPGIFACAQPRVSYDKPATNAGALRNLAGTEAAGFSKQGITHLNAHQCVSNVVRRVSMEPDGASGNRSRRMSVQFDRPLQRRSLPDKEAFAVTPRGEGAPIEIEEVRIPDEDLTRLLMTLSRPLSDGEQATASYRPRSGAGLKDTDGNMLAPFSAEVVAGEPPAPAVEAVALVSDPGADGVYTEGETVEAAVTFDASVRVDTANGTPTLALIANDGIRRAAYVSGSGTERLAFAYRVVAADGSVVAAVRAAASGLKPNGGAIAAAAGGTAASLAFGEAPG